MRLSAALALASLASVASAHFQLQFPDPRGEFDEDNEPNLCGMQFTKFYISRTNASLDGYKSVAKNRTQFPLDNGIVSLKSEHPNWTG